MCDGSSVSLFVSVMCVYVHACNGSLVLLFVSVICVYVSVSLFICPSVSYNYMIKAKLCLIESHMLNKMSLFSSL